MADPYQALYRRYRSKRFSEQRGQDHVMRALRTAVQEDRVGHAYLFSGPRGTGKTSTARILAKVLNCDAPRDGEPCCECDNCRAVDEGRIVDWLLELDAASHNGVANIRELIERIPLGISGNRKVVILDEVHMLSAGASNALLKSLEEPPSHVVFILATTDPQKVLPTIRSRTQHFEFHLLPADELAEHVRHVIADAGLDLGEEAVEHVVRRGGGSARDTLSALDQVAAMGGVVQEAQPVEAILEALCARNAGGALVAVADAVEAGRDPRALGEVLIARLRDAFLAVMGAPDRHLPPPDLERAAALGAELGAAGLTRALEVLGEALVELAKKPDPRIVLEVALVRLCRAESDRTIDAVLDRLERVERAVASGAGANAAAPAASASAPADVPAGAPTGEAPARPRPADLAREQLAKATESPARPARQPVKKATARPASAPPREAAMPTPEASPVDEVEPVSHAPHGDAGAGVPSRDELARAWAEVVFDGLPQMARSRFRVGRWAESEAGAAVFALDNEFSLRSAEERRAMVEEALAAHFGRPVPVRLVVDGAAADAPAGHPVPPSDAAASRAEEDELIEDVHELEDAPDAGSAAERLTEAFPGSELETP